MNGYKAFYSGKEADIYAVNLLQAKVKAIDHFKPPRSKQHMVHVHLCEKDGETILHSTASVG